MKKLKVTKSVKTMVWAVILVVVIPVLYIMLFLAKAHTEVTKNSPKVIKGYSSQKECEIATRTSCNLYKTIQEDQYWVANQ